MFGTKNFPLNFLHELLLASFLRLLKQLIGSCNEIEVFQIGCVVCQLIKH